MKLDLNPINEKFKIVVNSYKNHKIMFKFKIKKSRKKTYS